MRFGRALPFLLLACAAACVSTRAFAAHPRTDGVELSARWKTTPAMGIALHWRNVPADQDGDFYIVYLKGGDGRWLERTRIPSNKLNRAYDWTDFDVQPFHAHEYRVDCCDGDSADFSVIRQGYVTAGFQIPLNDHPGAVLLVVEAEQGLALAREIKQWMEDLSGDGWLPLRIDVKATFTAAQVKDAILAVHAKQPLEAVVLFGHVPVPYSGLQNPDGHPNHLGAWPTDAYYATGAEGWTDARVNETSAQHDHDPQRNYNVPGDGKFDQTIDLPPVLLQAGRIDLSNMPAFKAGETELLANYLGKTHRFRFKQLVAQPFAEIEDVLVYNGYAGVTYSSWAALCPVDPEIRPSFFEPNKRPERSAHLWGAIYDYGSFERQLSNYTRPDGLGGYSYSTQTFAESWNPSPVLESRALFTILDGSYFGDWDCRNNLLRAPLGNKRYGLTATWNRYPMRYHRMAAGGTVGDSTRDTQRIYQSGGYNTVSMGLMGDPTLRMHAAAPASALRADATADGVLLSWTASPDATHGYLVYRAASKLGPFARLTQAPVTETAFLDAAVPAGFAYYMVRAVANQETPSGSYLNLSQGVFTALKVPAPIANAPGVPELSIVSNGLSAQLAWSRVRAEAFRVYRGTSPGGPYRLQAEVPQFAFNDAILRRDTTYYYVVTSLRTLAGRRIESAPSNEVNTNTPPAIQIAAPADGSVFLPIYPRTLKVAFGADPESDPVTSVEYFVRDAAGRTSSLGKTSTAPFDLVWNEPPIGTYTLHAQCIDARGARSTSAPVRVTFRVDIAPGVTKVGISGAVELQGVVNLKKAMRFEFRPCDGVSPSFRREIILDEKGRFVFEGLPPNLYKVAIKGTKWLQRVVLVDATRGSVKDVHATLLGGEVVTLESPEDNAVDVLDLGALINRFGLRVAEHPEAYGADLNEDGVVGAADLDICIENFDVYGDP